MAIEFIAILFLVSTVLYVLLILALVYGFSQLKPISNHKNNEWVSVTIILPFFNEKSHIESCVRSILSQQTTCCNWELIAVNDQSTDGSEILVKNLFAERQNAELLHNPHKGKKRALLHGIQCAAGELIITIDADAYYPPLWLQTMVDSYRQSNAKLLIGPIKIGWTNNLFQQFQQIDFMSLVGSGAGAAGLNRPIMCNGANLAFDKEAFLQLSDPYRLKYLSGDDVFLLHAMKRRFPKNIHFVEDVAAIAETKPVKSCNQFFKQRRRWAGKTGGYSDSDSLVVAGLIAITALLVAGGACLVCIVPSLLPFWLVLYTSKLLVDSFFLWRVSGFLGGRKLLVWMPIFEFLFCFYVSMILLTFPLSKSNKTW